MNYNKTLIIKFLDDEIIIYNNNKINEEKIHNIINNNYITNYKLLNNDLKYILKKYKCLNLVIQPKIYILINKLYCQTNIFIIKNIMYNLGLNNYKIIYEEDYYKHLNDNILYVWKTHAIYINNNVEKYIDINNKKELNKIEKNTLIILSKQNIIKLNNYITYEYDYYPIFNLITY